MRKSSTAKSGRNKMEVHVMMTTKTRFSCLLLTLIVVLFGVLAAGCVNNQPPVEQPTRTEWPEAGVYYFDAGNGESTLTLNAGGAFALYLKGEHSSGTYELNEGAITLDFSAEGKDNLSATLEDNVITLTYEDASMRFLKKVNYKVHFETNGGDALEDLTVVNGKSVAKPAADPVRSGFLFVGWYADEAFTTPFAFDATPVTKDLTVYARWSEAPADGMEYSIVLDANYVGAEAVGTVQTVGGKLFDLPTLSREGYEFKGWWISMDDDGTKLSYLYEEGMALNANTTLYALWQASATADKLAAPVVNVTSGTIGWNAIEGARSYHVLVIGPDGAAVIDQSTSSTTLNVPFDTYAPGEYEIRVTANANAGESANSETVRFFSNKALGKVSVFDVVEPSTLVFNTVENAEKYIITVVCGNPDHNHTNFDNGSSRTFNFANCLMTENGIKFVVTAVAEGYASSTSAEFVYKRTLAPVEGLRVDEESQTVYWNDVEGAAQYMVSVKCGNPNHNHEFVNNGSKTYVSLKECASYTGGIVIKVYPIAKGYNSPEATQLAYEKTVLATPGSLRLNGTLLTWSEVTGANKYEVEINGTVHTVETTSLDIASLVSGVEGVDYEIRVRAVFASESLWSDVLVARYYEMSDRLSYSGSTLTWSPVIGAVSYEIQVNNGEIIPVADGSFSAKVALTKAGMNTVKVRFVDGSNRSEWASIEVFAHAVTFDSLGGSQVAVQYKAIGDIMELTAPVKKGYRFVSWYNVPGGPAANGMAYNDPFFSESGSIVLYAYYVSEEYELTYNYGLDGSGSETSAKVSFEKDFTLTVPTAKDPSVVFGGWFSAPYGMGIQYTDAKGNSVAPWGALNGGEVYAFWIDYSLNFTLTKVNGKDAYAVSKGDRIAMLDEITVPATYMGLPVAMISGNAFMDCTNLKVINLPASLELISLIDPFTGCTALEAVNVYDVEGVTAGRYSSVDGVLVDNGISATSQAKLLFMPLAKTGTYRIPANIAEIPEGAFANSSLSKIVIPAGVTKIGKGAFENCVNLTSVTFEIAEAGTTEQALTIGARAFSGCTKLEKITLPARLTEIALSKYSMINGEVYVDAATNAFAGCETLAAINVVSSNKTYKSVDGVLYSADGKTLYYCPETVEGVFTVPSGTQQIAAGAFIGCDEITEVILPNTVVLVGECAFYEMSYDFKKVTFLGDGFNDVTVGKLAFANSPALESVEFKSGSRVSVLSEGAFMGCEALNEFTIPASMTAIKSEAFRDCSDLETVIFAPNGKTLAFGEDVFYDCKSLRTVSLPANVSEIPGIFSGCASLEEVTVDPANPYFTAEDGVLFNKDKTEILFFPQGKSGEFQLPATVKTIANGVFGNVSKLSKLIIPAGIEVIGDDAFKNSSIAEIVFEGEAGAALTIGDRAFMGASVSSLALPAHTKSVGAYAFAESAIESITLNEGLESLGDYAFYQTTELETIHIPASLKMISNFCFAETVLETITFAENSQLKTIGDSAFLGEDSWWSSSGFLTSIEIPASVESIGRDAFRFLGDLREVTFAEGSQLKSIGAYAFDSCDYLETITLPKSLTSVGAYAFANCGYLEEVIFEEGGTEDLVLGALSYYDYVNVNGETVTEIEIGNVFNHCSYLAKVVLPSNLVEICEYSFYYAGGYLWGGESLEITLGENSRLATIGAYAFHYSGIKSIVIPKTVRSLPPMVYPEINYSYDRPGVGAGAFEGCYDTLESVIFEMGGTDPLAIGEGAFYNCDLLTELVFPARLAAYTNANGETVAPFANGANVFEESFGLTKIEIEDGGKYYVDVDGVVYTADMTELVICPASKTGTVTVPASVTKIHDRAFYSCTELEAVTFEVGASALTIGNEAFKSCESLKSIVLPTNTVSIGKGVFAKCYALETITLSKNLTAFDGSMIEYCSNVKSVTVEAGSQNFSSDDGVLYNGDKTVLVYYPTNRENVSYTVIGSVVSIAPNAFENNQTLETVVLPAGLIEINEKAFSGCSALKSVNIPNTVELIGAWAFSNCTSLADLSFEMGGTGKMVVGKYAFQRIADTNVTLPATMSVIDNYIFYYASVERVTFENGSQLYSMGDAVFQGSKLISIALPAGLRLVGDATFYGCSDLQVVSFGEGLVSIGSETFVDSSVERVSFPASLKTMGDENFAECSNLKEVIFADNAQLEKIPVGTFYGSSLETFTVPASVQEIEDKDISTSYSYGAFQNCDSLKTVTFADGSRCAKIGIRAFYDCNNLAMITLPSSVSTLGDEVFYGCSALESIIVPATVTQMGEGLFNGCSSLSTVILNTKATELPAYMFASCAALTTVQIPETVAKIGSSCFSGTSLESIIVPASVVDMSGYSIFRNCESLTTVTILGNVKVIGESMFEGCINLESVTLPESVETIEEDVFMDCVKLTTFEIPKGLKTLNPAFSGSGLASYTVAEGNTAFAASEGVLFSADKTQILSYPVNKTSVTFTVPKEVTALNAGTFDGVTCLKQIIFEEGGTEALIIGDEAFADFLSLAVIVFPERLEKIGDEAFAYCYNLTTVNLPKNLKASDIGEDAFYYCVKLVEVYNQSEMEISVGSYDFGYVAYYAENVATTEEERKLSIDENGHITYVDGDTTYYVGYAGADTEITVPAGVDAIYGYAFISSNATKVILPDGLTVIMDGAFDGCESLVEVVLPSTLKEIGEEVFYDCSALTTIVLPDGLESIGRYAFYYCEGLTEITIPASVTSMGSSVFSGCSNLTVLTSLTEEPYGWSSSWKGSASVIFGFDGLEHTYTFETNGGTAVESITATYTITLPAAPEKEGFIFMGWYDNAEFEGNALSGAYYSKDKTQLYARWLSEDDMDLLYAGTDFQYAINLELGEFYNVEIKEGGQWVYFKFVPAASGTYTLSSYSDNDSLDTMCYIYDSDEYRLGSYDSNEDGYYHFDAERDLTAGETYYYVVRLYSSYATDSFNIQLVQE
ncbi:MAG: hypothetical protein E7620_02130 [Ruminococcaceae bacterium]|nr:hypothetical protein [Oscillospiraceae bacterium]